MTEVDERKDTGPTPNNPSSDQRDELKQAAAVATAGPLLWIEGDKRQDRPLKKSQRLKNRSHDEA